MLFLRAVLFLTFLIGPLCADVTFEPPKGWKLTDKNSLPESVLVMVVGTGQGVYPSSINVSYESFSGNLKDYLKIVKEINQQKRAQWKDLGSIQTKAGSASLSQVDLATEWGNVRMMHVILVQDGTAYIMTAAALRDEFSRYYKDFFNTMKSLDIKK